jgi:hypothetical protein
MGLVIVEGFDVLRDSDVVPKYPLSDSLSPAMVAGRFGGQAWRPDIGNQNRFFRFSMPAATANGAVGVALQIPSGTLSGMGAGIGVMNFYDSASAVQCSVCIAADGSVSVRRGTANVLATSAVGVFTGSAWHYLECEVIVSDTVGRMTVWLNGVQIVTASGVDTKASASIGTFSSVRLSVVGSGSNGLLLDDLYACDDAVRLGESRVETLSPTADSGTQQWTPSTGSANYAMVDELPTNAGTDYVAAATAGLVDKYVMADLSSVPNAIHGVKSTMFAAKDDLTTRAARLNLTSGATTANGAALPLTTSYQWQDDLYLLDPNTAAAWTASGVNALQAGPEVTV